MIHDSKFHLFFHTYDNCTFQRTHKLRKYNKIKQIYYKIFEIFWKRQYLSFFVLSNLISMEIIYASCKFNLF